MKINGAGSRHGTGIKFKQFSFCCGSLYVLEDDDATNKGPEQILRQCTGHPHLHLHAGPQSTVTREKNHYETPTRPIAEGKVTRGKISFIQQIFIEHLLCAPAEGATSNKTMFLCLWTFALVEETNSKPINKTVFDGGKSYT